MRDGEERAASLVLARAFREDPVHRWVLPLEIDWSLFSARFFTAVARDSLRNGCAFTTDGNEAVALWMPPYPKPIPRSQRVATALGWCLALGRRGFQIADELERLEAARPLTPHWYLTVLGTDPRWQAQGFGRALLADRLAHCDETATPAYLESSREENLPFYEHSGFRVEEAVALAGGPTVWRMWREPASGRRGGPTHGA